jgi:hypothetical protein
MDSLVTSAHWLAGRACLRVFHGLPLVELELRDAASVFETARREVALMLAAEPADDNRVLGLLVGAEACRRAGDIPESWLGMLTAIVGSPWKEYLPPRARERVRMRWSNIERVAAELLYERFVLVSRVVELCGVRDFAS